MERANADSVPGYSAVVTDAQNVWSNTQKGNQGNQQFFGASETFSSRPISTKADESSRNETCETALNLSWKSKCSSSESLEPSNCFGPSICLGEPNRGSKTDFVSTRTQGADDQPKSKEAVNVKKSFPTDEEVTSTTSVAFPSPERSMRVNENQHPARSVGSSTMTHAQKMPEKMSAFHPVQERSSPEWAETEQAKNDFTRTVRAEYRPSEYLKESPFSAFHRPEIVSSREKERRSARDAPFEKHVSFNGKDLQQEEDALHFSRISRSFAPQREGLIRSSGKHPTETSHPDNFRLLRDSLQHDQRLYDHSRIWDQALPPNTFRHFPSLAPFGFHPSGYRSMDPRLVENCSSVAHVMPPLPFPVPLDLMGYSDPRMPITNYYLTLARMHYEQQQRQRIMADDLGRFRMTTKDFNLTFSPRKSETDATKTPEAPKRKMTSSFGEPALSPEYLGRLVELSTPFRESLAAHVGPGSSTTERDKLDQRAVCQDERAFAPQPMATRINRTAPAGTTGKVLAWTICGATWRMQVVSLPPQTKAGSGVPCQEATNRGAQVSA